MVQAFQVASRFRLLRDGKRVCLQGPEFAPQETKAAGAKRGTKAGKPPIGAGTGNCRARDRWPKTVSYFVRPTTPA